MQSQIYSSLFVILFAGASVAQAELTELDVSRCEHGDSIMVRIHSGQGVESLEIVQTLSKTKCEVNYRKEIEGGYTIYRCEYPRTAGALSFQNFTQDKCKRTKSGNGFADFHKSRKLIPTTSPRLKPSNPHR